jgi:serine/threonine protein kinase
VWEREAKATASRDPPLIPDIFSLGVVLHEALTGKLPYSSEEPNVPRREIVSGVKRSRPRNYQPN